MSNAWEVTTEDIQDVLAAHEVHFSETETEELLEDIDVDAIENGLLYYMNMKDQIESANSDIEDFLMKKGIISGEKLFHNPS